MKIKLMPIILILLFTVAVSAEKYPAINWNDNQLKWHNYEQGIDEIKSTGKPGMFIIYADWCPTCKSYSKLFANKKVVESVKDIILIRMNQDTNPELSNIYSKDGLYLPRTFALSNHGKVMLNFYSSDAKYTFFLPPENPEYLTKFAQLIRKHGIIEE